MAGVVKPGAAVGGEDRVLVMIGFMGAGKSTAAVSAARALGADAIDVDQVIEQRLGKPIDRIFAEDGEPAFRATEERITLELLGEPRAGGRVVALGGGALGSEKVRAALRGHLVTWIDVDLDTAWRRCQGTGRPLATDRSEFERLYAAREPVYTEAADVVVPHHRAAEMAAVLAALEGLPTPASPCCGRPARRATTRPTSARACSASAPFWPATVAGRRFLVTDYNAGRLYGDALSPLDGRVDDHARRAVQDDRSRRDRVVRAGARRHDACRRRGRARRRCRR